VLKEANPDGSGAIDLATFKSGASWSPDGAYLLVFYLDPFGRPPLIDLYDVASRQFVFTQLTGVASWRP
jgi:hypothetical protein